jgi:putative phosphoesterase
MEIAVIADVHANLPAFEAVLEDIGGLEIFSCGDIVGYNPFPNETLEIFSKRGIAGIIGNHDQALLIGDTGWFNASAAQSINWSRDRVSNKNRGYLQSLPEIFQNEKFKAVHGSPRNLLYEYVFPECPEETLSSFLKDTDVLVLGHTHIPFIKQMKKGLVFNPGSVGQPRDGDHRASYAIYDPEKGKVNIKRVSYDIDRVAKEIEKKGLTGDLAERLYKGE